MCSIVQTFEREFGSRKGTAMDTRTSPRGTRSRDDRHRVRRSDPALRLTRRGRLVAFSASVAALGAIVIGAGQVAGASGSDSQASNSPAEQVVVVQAGETLWGIAREVAPGSDPRGVVRQIRQMNDLGTTPVVPGQSIVVPVLG
ncbi:MAG: peptidoglycan-binding protein [Micrococcales bacterium]|nr:peptidoglycan-binding protein [Micrococcales bacterium]